MCCGAGAYPAGRLRFHLFDKLKKLVAYLRNFFQNCFNILTCFNDILVPYSTGNSLMRKIYSQHRYRTGSGLNFCCVIGSTGTNANFKFKECTKSRLQWKERSPPWQRLFLHWNLRSMQVIIALLKFLIV